MFHKNLQYHRLKNGLSKKHLAELVGVTPMAISHYEAGDRKPDMDTIRALASALGIRVSDFLVSRNENIVFRHGDFRKKSDLPKAQQEYIHACAEEYFSRFMDIVEIISGDVLPPPPLCGALPITGDAEQDAAALRRHLGFSEDGHIDDLLSRLEDKGILLFLHAVEDSSFSGVNGFVNAYPYIMLNAKMTAERNRSTAVHELAHLMFDWNTLPPSLNEEKYATEIGGAFLFPRADVIRELGIRRSSVSVDMTMIAEEYGISMMLLATRAHKCGIITDSTARSFFIKASRIGWRTDEPSRIPVEEPSLFRQLVFRAVSEEEISIQKGAELLGRSYADVASACGAAEWSL